MKTNFPEGYMFQISDNFVNQMAEAAEILEKESQLEFVEIPGSNGMKLVKDGTPEWEKRKDTPSFVSTHDFNGLKVHLCHN